MQCSESGHCAECVGCGRKRKQTLFQKNGWNLFWRKVCRWFQHLLQLRSIRENKANQNPQKNMFAQKYIWGVLRGHIFENLPVQK